MLTDGCKCSSKCPLTDDITLLAPPTCGCDYGPSQPSCLEMKPMKLQAAHGKLLGSGTEAA